ncbi:MAG: RNA methyltransferase [Polyangiales bacterium]
MKRGPADTECVVGLGAAHAVLRARPRDVLNIAHTQSARAALRELLRQAARHRIAYREVDPDELGRIAGTVHHEGVCLLVRRRTDVKLAVLREALTQGGLLLALDRVENPHNVGALLRSAAWFGVAGLVIAGPHDARGLPPSAVRVAEGGAEFVPTCFVPALAPALAQLAKSGVAIVGADAGVGTPITDYVFPPRAVLVLGSERHGLAPEVKQHCTALVHIEGTDRVESLNVSVAAGIMLAFATRPRGARAT